MEVDSDEEFTKSAQIINEEPGGSVKAKKLRKADILDFSEIEKLKN